MPIAEFLAIADRDTIYGADSKNVTEPSPSICGCKKSLLDLDYAL